MIINIYMRGDIRIILSCMNSTVTYSHKPFGYVSPKSMHLATPEELMYGEKAQVGGGLVGFYISIMIAVILVLDVVWPTIDSHVNSNSSSYANLSATAKTLIGLFGLILALGLLIMMLRPVM